MHMKNIYCWRSRDTRWVTCLRRPVAVASWPLFSADLAAASSASGVPSAEDPRCTDASRLHRDTRTTFGETRREL